jgi:light-regulated signal transduction histidine kinase (bacteriophytochrome)
MLNSRKMAALIDALLSLSRVTRGECRRDVVNLSELVATTCAELQARDPARSVECLVAEGVQARLDPALARALVENLLSNAWKFTNKTRGARLEFGVTLQAGIRTFYVRDNGAGFDMAYASKLFVPFQRLHAAEEFHGTGIGLATVQRIIGRHGGRIWAHGQVGAGATFFFSLPAGDTE